LPLLELDDASRHTDVAALLKYVEDPDRTHALLPEATPDTRLDRLAVIEWLGFVATELHKVFSPWLWLAETADSTKQACRDELALRFAELDRHFALQDWLALNRFAVADAYAFAIVNWANMLRLDLKPYPNLHAQLARVAARPEGNAALVAEGLAKS
jgi:glutathione S-transferase